eukprot:TRINITY_DN95819_c0_g1_i1.p1 TRINITY_DN95819_c0_g1~~TRINITY_DN95819_c0_g1_i1.p1  ORF type:complete len:137 (+),score=43.53 TRINITY_DN95819_c0_g1_i1:110-520(+)
MRRFVPAIVLVVLAQSAVADQSKGPDGKGGKEGKVPDMAELERLASKVSTSVGGLGKSGNEATGPGVSVPRRDMELMLRLEKRIALVQEWTNSFSRRYAVQAGPQEEVGDGKDGKGKEAKDGKGGKTEAKKDAGGD